MSARQARRRSLADRIETVLWRSITGLGVMILIIAYTALL